MKPSVHKGFAVITFYRMCSNSVILVTMDGAPSVPFYLFIIL